MAAIGYPINKEALNVELVVSRGTHYEPKKVSHYGDPIWKIPPQSIYFEITDYPDCCGLTILSGTWCDSRAANTRQLYRWIDKLWEKIRPKLTRNDNITVSCVIPTNISNMPDAMDDGESNTKFCIRTVIKRWVEQEYIIIEGRTEFPNTSSGNDLEHVLFTIA